MIIFKPKIDTIFEIVTHFFSRSNLHMHINENGQTFRYYLKKQFNGRVYF